MADQVEIFVPEATFPESENALVSEIYGNAGVILEYGSGASTFLAAELGAKKIISVESDAGWAANMDALVQKRDLADRIRIHYANIGPTGKWGRPVDASGWKRYHRYPLSVWELDDFDHPDVIMIDGRFRAGCLLAALFFIKKPVKVLFDDYVNRPQYAKAVEGYIKPSKIVGRMALFDLEPRPFSVADFSKVIPIFQHSF